MAKLKLKKYMIFYIKSQVLLYKLNTLQLKKYVKLECGNLFTGEGVYTALIWNYESTFDSVVGKNNIKGVSHYSSLHLS